MTAPKEPEKNSKDADKEAKEKYEAENKRKLEQGLETKEEQERRKALIEQAEKGDLPGAGSKAKGDAEVSKPTKEAEEEERKRNIEMARGGVDFRR
jgi:hypothetical protein